MNIPIANLYYLLSYAWGVLDEGDLAQVERDNPRDLSNLFARVLLNGLKRSVRRGLDRGYVPHACEVGGVKGKIDLGGTIKGGALWRRRVRCSFGELSYDVLVNQVVKAALKLLRRVHDLDPQLRRDAGQALGTLSTVTDVRLSSEMFRRVHIHRNNRHYRLLVEVSRLVWENVLIEKGSSGAVFRDFVRDPASMRRLFELFLRRFYEQEQSRYSVRSRRLSWQQVTGDPQSLRLLPRMLTDVSLDSNDRSIVLEAKFTPRSLSSRADWRQTLRSEHLYQLYAYIQNLRLQESAGKLVSGVLVYPTAGQQLDASYEIQGLQVRVVSVDLARHWSEIHEQLMELLPPADRDRSSSINAL